jgi:hypothetical protein
MRNRGPTYWNWNDAQLQTITHEEELDDGTKIDVQARISRTGGTQMFIGVYLMDGRIMCEEVYDCMPGQTTTRALVSGTQRARAVAIGSDAPLDIAKHA